MEISPVTLDLPECSPNLMPFHISHSGPAPISTYFRVKPSTPSSPYLSLTQNTSNETHLSTDNSQNTLVAEDSQSSLTTIAESQSALLEEDSQACPAGVDTSIADADSGTQASPSSELARAPPTAPPVEGSLSNNFTAAFRGRQVHGRTVDLPQGYGGIVLSAPSSDINSQGDDIGTVETIAQTRRKSRATRTCSRQMETDKDDAVDADHDDSRVEIRRLTPVSKFSSLTVWSPDIPVDEGKDEYLRSLTEWTKLAAESLGLDLVAYSSICVTRNNTMPAQHPVSIIVNTNAAISTIVLSLVLIGTLCVHISCPEDMMKGRHSRGKCNRDATTSTEYVYNVEGDEIAIR
ncbi:ribonuclease H2 non-catalytic subunit-domain-containing protein [Suillus subaureus]|uniref:Ribonuclease H2 non-catalytic subunit-domain-containing protein n=1 Tax=Suillus subaureus TaxID=48587 RepID=A0A9P7E7D2_9AGAM|nr:ribonuclease H2 non-catalytic subunit-domain-containing protein [Suillus subaureus]KAG1812859.1 ribonuclease H2 non-catalytic subunit-domain-containing protein [Suillus subaureus]